MRHAYTTIDVPSIRCSDGGNSLHLLLTDPGGTSCCLSCMLTLIVNSTTDAMRASMLLGNLVELLHYEPSLLSESGEAIHSWMISLIISFRSPPRSTSSTSDNSTQHCAAALDSFLALALAMDAPFVLQSLHDGFASTNQNDDTKAILALLVSDLLAPPVITSDVDDDTRALSDGSLHHPATQVHELFFNALLGGTDTHHHTVMEGPRLTSLLLQQTSLWLSSQTLMQQQSQETSDHQRASSEGARRGLVSLMCYVSLQLVERSADLAARLDLDVMQALVQGCAQSAKRFHMAPCDITANALALLSAALDRVAVVGSSQPPQVRLHSRKSHPRPSLSIASETHNPYVSFLSSHMEDSLSGTMRDESQHAPFDDSTSDDESRPADAQQRVEQMCHDVLTCLMPLMLSTSEMIAATASRIVGRCLGPDMVSHDSTMRGDVAERVFEHACEAMRMRGGSRSTCCVPIFDLASQSYEVLVNGAMRHQQRTLIKPLLGVHLLEIMDANAAYFTETVVVSELFIAAMALSDIHEVTKHVLHLVKLAGMTLHSMVVLLHVVLEHPGAATLSSTTIQLLAHNTRLLVLDPLVRTEEGHEGAVSSGLSGLSSWLQIRVCSIVVKLAEMTNAVHDWCTHVYHHLRDVTRAPSLHPSSHSSGQPSVLLGSVCFPILLKVVRVVAEAGMRETLEEGAGVNVAACSGALLDDIADFCVQVLATSGGVGAAANDAHQLLESITSRCVRPNDAVMMLPASSIKGLFSRSRGYPNSFHEFADMHLSGATASEVACGVLIALARIRLYSGGVAPRREDVLPSAAAIVKGLQTLHNALQSGEEYNTGILIPDALLWGYYVLFLRCSQIGGTAPSSWAVLIQDVALGSGNVTTDKGTHGNTGGGARNVSIAGGEFLWHFACQTVPDGTDVMMCFLEQLASGVLLPSSHREYSDTISVLFGTAILHMLQINGHCIEFLSSLCRRLESVASLVCGSGTSASESTMTTLLHCICRNAFTPTLQLINTSNGYPFAVGDSVLNFLAGCQEAMPTAVSHLLAHHYMGPFLMSSTREEIVTSSVHRVDAIARILLPCLTLVPESTNRSHRDHRHYDQSSMSCTSAPFLRVFAHWALDALECHHNAEQWGCHDTGPGPSVKECPVARVLSACLELKCGGDIASRIVRRLASSSSSHHQQQGRPPALSFDCLQLRLSVFRALQCDASASLVKHTMTLPAMLRLVPRGGNKSELVGLEKVAGLCCSFFEIVIASDAKTHRDSQAHLNSALWVGFAIEVFLRMCMVASPPSPPSPPCLLLCAAVLRQFPEKVHLPVVLALTLQLQKIFTLANIVTPLNAVTVSALQLLLHVLTGSHPIWAEMSTVGANAIEQLSKQCDALGVRGTASDIQPLSSSSQSISVEHNHSEHFDCSGGSRRPHFCALTCGVSLDYFVCLFV
jgi:hypothetical protein